MSEKKTTDWDGCPENPDRDGLHWLRRVHRDHDTVHRWIADDKIWRGGGDDFGPDWAARHWRYLGRVVTPAEIERLRAGLKEVSDIERVACIADVEAEAEFPGEPTAEQIALIQEHPIMAMREAVRITKNCIIARIRARAALPEKDNG